MLNAGRFRKAVLILLPFLPCLSLAGAWAQGEEGRPPVKTVETRRARPEIEALVEQARAVPPEFAADALIRIAESDRLKAETRRALLEEAFTLAAGARAPLRLAAVPGSAVDTRAGYASRAFELQLDALSLQTRVVKAMLALDKRRAREMFRGLPPPRFASLRCADALAHDVSAFYETLSALALDAFSAEEKSRYEQVGFVEPYLNELTSPVQVGPAAAVITSLKLPAAQFERLLSAFSRGLMKSTGDDRAFSFAVAQGAVARGVASLAETAKQRGVPREELLKATREFLVSHLRARRCADNVNVGRGYLSDPANSDYYNKTIAEIDPKGKTLSLLSPDDVKPSKVEGAAEVHPHWTTAGARKLLTTFKTLRFGSGEKPLTVNYRRRNPEWDSDLNRFLGELSSWRSDEEESEEDYYHQKSVLYEGLLDLVPAGPKRDAVLSGYVSFLRKPIIQQDKPLEWFLHVDDLLRWARPLRGEERVHVLDELENAGDPVLQLYARLEKVLPRKGGGETPPETTPSLEGNVTFKLKGFPYADVVALAGSFNEWHQSRTLCAQLEGEWVCRLNLTPGRYAYKFIVDGEWMIDPANPLKEDDGNGNINSILVVEENPE